MTRGKANQPPTKRNFFLENASIFEFGFNSPRTPLLKHFFSQRIGLGTIVPIDWSACLTGRTRPWSIGLLDVLAQPGSRSNIGVIAANREQDGIGYLFEL